MTEERPSLQREVKAPKLKAPKQLLVEGRTPEIFFREWVRKLGLDGKLEVWNFGATTDLTGFLRLFAGSQPFRELPVDCVGIIRDAEANPADSAFQSVCDNLAKASLPSPNVCGQFSDGSPRIGVFILPNCKEPGMLETLCWSALESDPENSAHLACVIDHLGCLDRHQITVKNPTKAKVWTYLAGCGDFDPQVGRAAQKNVFKWDSAALAPLTEFLKSLASHPAQ